MPGKTLPETSRIHPNPHARGSSPAGLGHANECNEAKTAAAANILFILFEIKLPNLHAPKQRIKNAMI